MVLYAKNDMRGAHIRGNGRREFQWGVTIEASAVDVFSSKEVPEEHVCILPSQHNCADAPEVKVSVLGESVN